VGQIERLVLSEGDILEKYLDIVGAQKLIQVLNKVGMVIHAGRM